MYEINLQGLSFSTGQEFEVTSKIRTRDFYIRSIPKKPTEGGDHLGYVRFIQEKPTVGQKFRAVRKVRQGDDFFPVWEVEEITSSWFGTSTSNNSGGAKMNGQVFEGVVVRAKKIAAGEGVTCAAIDKSEIVHSKGPFIARDAAMAQAVILAEAIGKISGLEVDDPTQPVEVKTRVYGS